MADSCIRIHVLTKSFGEKNKFLDWYLNKTLYYGLKVYVDVLDWGFLPEWVKEYDEKVYRWQVSNEWLACFPPDHHAYPQKCENYKRDYSQGKEYRLKSIIGMDLWNLGKRGHEKVLNSLRKRKVSYDFLGWDYYTRAGR